MNEAEWEARAKLITQIAVSTIVLAVALGFLIFGKNEASTSWAVGIIGVVVGYWLR